MPSGLSRNHYLLALDIITRWAKNAGHKVVEVGASAWRIVLEHA